MTSESACRVRPLTSAGLAVFMALSVWPPCPAHPAALQAVSQQEVNRVSDDAQAAGGVYQLVPGQPVERELQGSGKHTYEITLEPGVYIEVEALQQGIDFALWLLAPGAEPIKVDSPNGSYGPERAFQVAETGGPYRIEVMSEYPEDAPGRYTLTVSPPRPATPQDRTHLEAWKLFLEGEKRRRDETLTETRRYEEARTGYEQALALWRGLSRPAWEAESLLRIGWMEQQLSRFREALPPLEEALSLFRRLGQSFETALVLVRISSSAFQLDDLDRAMAASQEALELARPLERPEVEAGALHSLGNVLKLRGDRPKAMEVYKEALARARAARAADDEGFALYELGDLLLGQGKLEHSRDTLEQALAALRLAGANREVGYTLRRLADLDLRLGNAESAETRLRQAVGVARQTGDRNGEAVALNSLAAVYVVQAGGDENAKKAAEQALEIFREEKHRRGEAAALLSLGRALHAAQRRDEALAYYDQSLSLFKELEDASNEASALFGGAQVLHDRQDFAAADARLRQVVPRIESLRSESESPEGRAVYFATKQHYFDLHIDVLMHLHEANRAGGFGRQALELNERRRARSFLERLEESRAGLYRTADVSLLDQRRSLQESLNATEREMAELRYRPHSEGPLRSLEKQQQALLDQLDALLTEIKKKSLLYVVLTRPEPLPLEEMQKSVLEPHTLLLVYSLGTERSFLWLVPHEGEIEAHVLPPRRYLEEAAQGVLAGWESRSPNRFRDSADRWAKTLSTELLKPIANHLGGKRLLVVSDGALQHLPFAALPDPRFAGDKPMLAQHEIIHLPSASVLAALRQQKRRGDAPLWAAVFADPVFDESDPRLAAQRDRAAAEIKPNDGGLEPTELERSARDLGISRFPRLRHTAGEASVLRDLLGSHDEEQVFEAVGLEANLPHLRRIQLAAYKILHFATHGLLNEKHPELSGLVLSSFDEKGQPLQDNFLLAHEISDLDLLAELVVLSACQTGVGPEIRGEGLMALTRSFLYAGTPRVLVSLWNVNDRATADLMERFYRLMVEGGLRAPAALRYAQLAMLQDPSLADPYLWAPFIFQGEWRDDPGQAAPAPPIEKVTSGSVTTGATIPDVSLPGGGDKSRPSSDLDKPPGGE